MTPQEWLAALEKKLREQQMHARRYDRYYNGESVLEIVTEDFRDVFGGKFDPVRTNLCRVVTEAKAERLEVEYFAVGGDDDQAGSDAARAIWDENDLGEMSQIAHTELLVKSRVFTLTWPGDVADEDTPPVISIEDPEQMVVARRQRPPYDVIAALKVWVDEWDGRERAELYLPDEVHRFRRRNAPSQTTPRGGPTGLWIPPVVVGMGNEWVADTYDNGEGSIRNGYGAVPVVELANRARLLREPQSDLVDIAPLQDASDKLLADLIISASFGAIPVRTATGLVFKTDKDGHPVDEHGNRITPFDVRADRVWISPDAQSKFGTLEGSSLEGFIKGREAIHQDVRTLSRVPYHYFDMGGTSNVAGETLKAMETPLVRTVDGLQTRLGPGWAKTVRFGLSGTQFAGAPVKTRWADTETKADANLYDAFSKSIEHVPLEVALEKVLGWDRELIRRTMRIREEEGLAADAALQLLTRDAA